MHTFIIINDLNNIYSSFYSCIAGVIYYLWNQIIYNYFSSIFKTYIWVGWPESRHRPLINLTTLFLNSNRLPTLPPKIGTLTKLTTLYLYNNRLTILSFNYKKMKKLEYLYMSNQNLLLNQKIINIYYLRYIYLKAKFNRAKSAHLWMFLIWIFIDDLI